jgi:hypothetical protein
MSARTAFMMLAASLSFPFVSVAARPEPRNDSIRLDVQMVSVSPATALTLVPALQDARTTAKAYAELQAMLARDEATLLAWPVLWLRHGEFASCETGEEFRYPTEFDPPEAPQGFGTRNRQVTRPTWGDIVPTAFETRMVGSTLGAQAQIDEDGKTVTVSLSPTMVRFLRFSEWRKQVSPIGVEGVMVQPQFRSTKLDVRLRLRPDQPTLLATAVVPEPAPRVELFIVRVKLPYLNEGAGK